MFLLFKYRLPFASVFKTAKGNFRDREGFFLLFEHAEFDLLGEVSPLPGFSDETIDDCLAFIRRNSKETESRLRNRLNIVENLPVDDIDNTDVISYFMSDRKIFSPGHDHTIPKSITFALDCMVLQAFLSKWRHKIPVPSPLLVNVTSNTLEHFGDFYKQGFKVFKVKAGFDEDSDIGFIKQLRDHFPDAVIRVDANARWNFETAMRIIPAMVPYNIEYIEQPLNREELLLHGQTLRELGIPIAADESIRSIDDVKSVIQSKCADILILKPPMIGGISQLPEIIKLAGNNSLDMVITTSLDAGPNRRLTAWLAATLFNGSRAHGIATGYLLSKDIYSDGKNIKDGFYHADIPLFHDAKSILTGADLEPIQL